VPTNIIGNMTIRLSSLLSIYNCAINCAQFVSVLLQEAQIQKYTEIVFHILGHIGTSIASHNIIIVTALPASLESIVM